MKIANLSRSGSVGVCVLLLLLSPAMRQRAHAFGGLWSARSAPVHQVAEDILFVDNPDATVTAIVQIHYLGRAERFAWVIPVPVTPTVGVSSNAVFQRLEAATAPQYWVEQAVQDMCMPQDEHQDVGSSAAGAASSDGATGMSVAVMDQGTVGPYDYVTITVDPGVGDPAAVASDWFALNGYDLTGLDSEVLRPYLEDGLNLLAFKLSAGKDAGAIRPVLLTYESDRPTIPIRPAAVAALDDMGIRVWVIGPAQAVPTNYKSLVLNDALIDWLSGKKFVAGTLPAGGAGPFGPVVSKPSNYDAVVSAAANEAGGRGFVTELGGPASQYRDRVWSPLDEQQFATLSNQPYADGLDAILAASRYYRAWDGFSDAVQEATTLPEAVTFDAFMRNPDAYRGVATIDTVKFLQRLDETVVKPVADTAALLWAAPYLTRLYTTLSADEMTLDPVFDYNPDLAQVSGMHIARQSLQCSPELHASDAPWRIDLPQGGVVVGEGSGGWPLAAGSLPANLKVVKLSSSGSGAVVEDNSQAIGAALFETAGSRGVAMLASPPNGVLIGATQSVTPYTPSASTPPTTKRSSGSACSVSRAGTGRGSSLAPWGLFAALWLALRRRVGRLLSARDVPRPTGARHGRLLAGCAWACLLFAGCSSAESVPAHVDAGESVPPGNLTRAQLRDPETCRGCHPIHYREWSASMHAYAARDPVFLAMNRRGQRETHGELGDFCVKCHAPMAVLDKRTRDGLNLDQLPDKERGVSCYFCHNTHGIDGDHNAMLQLANDTTMRGPIRDPLQPGVHQAEFSELFDEPSPKSSAMCGGCHDIVTPSGVHLERTFQEYRSGIFSKSSTGQPPAFASCVGCHMPGREALAAVAPEGVGMRTVHEHLWPGVDVALTDFPYRDAMRSAVEDCQLGAASLSFFTLEVTPPDLFTFQIETNAGHDQPSGAAEDRRMWLEFLAYDDDGQLLEQVSSGNIADGELEEKSQRDPKRDPHLLMFRDHIYDAQGKPVNMFWEAQKSKAHPEGYESSALPVSTTTYIEGKHAVIKQYRASGPNGLPARVTARLRMRPIGVEVLQDLVDSGDLDPAIAARMQTLTFGAQIEWTKQSGLMKTLSANMKTDCSTYRCMLDPTSRDCR